jgi:diguanylate cyclase (GGDEF)-like protein
MTGARADHPALPLAALGQMMPLYVWLDAGLTIRAAGPTLGKICAQSPAGGPATGVEGGVADHRAADHGPSTAPKEAVSADTAPAEAAPPDTATAGAAPPEARATGDGLSPGAHAQNAPGGGLVGRPFDAVFDIQRPRRLRSDTPHLQRLRLCLRAAPCTAFRGVAVPLGPPDGGLFLNLSFGISVAEAVRAHDLTDSDFAATDLAVELLYLQEANAAVLSELRRANSRLTSAKSDAEEQALTDTLTGLRNRRAMDRALSASTRTNMPFGLMHVDLDYFKQVNDTLGHAAGDHVLAEVARALREETRAGDIVARVGGDEFVLLFPGLTEADALSGIAERIIRRLETPIRWQGRACRVSASIGFTASTLYARPEPDRLLSDADDALYQSKRMGRGVATQFIPGAWPPA